MLTSAYAVTLSASHILGWVFFAGPTVEQQAEMARAGGRTLAALQPEQVTEQYGQILQHRLTT